jgi:hypothetical protein
VGAGFSGVEGALLPVSFLAVTALAKFGRVEEATRRLDRLCAALPRLLSQEVGPATGRLLGNTSLVWSHAELARAVYVLDAARRRQQWEVAASCAWRLRTWDYAAASGAASRQDAHPNAKPQEDSMHIRTRPAGPPAAEVRPGSGRRGSRMSRPAKRWQR